MIISKAIALSKFTCLKLINIYRLFFLDRNECLFINFAKKQWPSKQRKNGILLIETMKYHPYIFQVSYLSNFLADKFQLEIKTIVNVYDNKNIWLNKHLNKFLTTSRLFHSFGASSSLNYYSLSKNEIEICKKLALVAFNKISSKSDLLEMKIEDIAVGDLIYDTHLRLYKLATVNINDDRLLKTIENAYIIFASCKNYLDTNNVKMLVMLHAVYIQHAILVRQTLSREIPTYLYGHREGRLLQKLSKQHFYQSLNHHKYKNIFGSLTNKNDKLNLAKNALYRRVSGEIDTGISYMKKSAYIGYTESSFQPFKPSNKPRVVVFLHCFFDSPHIYKDMLFNDFHEWLEFTLEVASRSNYDCYVKPHPNGLDGNEEIVDYFIKKYGKISFIDKNVSNRQLINEGFNLGVTLYGTIAHELAYHDIPVLAAGDNPHACYSFCYKAKSIMDYEEKLGAPSSVPKMIIKAEIEEFFYMHYLYQADIYSSTKGNWEHSLHKIKSKDSDVLNPLMAEAESNKFKDLNFYFEEVLNHLNTTN
jgi:hypothetical protein